MRTRHVGVLACVAVMAWACQSSDLRTAPADSSIPAESTEAVPAPDSNLAAEQILRVDISAEPLGLDPTVMGAPEILRALQRPLVDFNERQEIVPALAESWDVSSDATTLTFHLRDARYSNGDPIVAGDFVYSARRLADPRIAAGYSYVMDRVVGGPEVLAMAGADPAPTDEEIKAALDNLGVEAPDDRTFVVHLNRPASFFLSELTLWFFVPLQERWITSPNATEAGNYVSSGPFILDTWEHNVRIVLKPNPYWWGDLKPTLDEIQMSMLGLSNAQLAYEADEIDIVTVQNPDIERFKSDPVLSAQYHEAPAIALNFYSFNNFQDPHTAANGSAGPTANKDFRIALTQAIDKRALIDATYGGLGVVANSVVMPGIRGYQPDLNPYPFDLSSSRQHMDAALDALGVSAVAELPKLKLSFITGFDNEPRVLFLAEAWRQAFGLEVAQAGSERGVFFEDRSAGRYDIAFDGWGADYPHPVNQLDGLFTCGGGNNNAKYCNPAFDALLEKAAAEPDADRQIAIYQEAERLLMSDAPILPLRFPVTPYAIKPYVSHLTPMPTDFRVPGDYYYETVQILKH